MIRKFVTAVSRIRLYELMYEGTLKSRLVQRPGAKRGIRLIEAKSLDAWIDSFDAHGERSKDALV